MRLLTLQIVLFLTYSNKVFCLFSAAISISVFHTFFLVLLFSPSLSNFPLQESHSKIYFVWFEFITISIRFHNNIPYKKVSLETANKVSKEKKKWKKKKKRTVIFLKTCFVYIKFLLHLSLFLELSAAI